MPAIWNPVLKVAIAITYIDGDGREDEMAVQTCMGCGSLVPAGSDAIGAHERWHDRIELPENEAAE